MDRKQLIIIGAGKGVEGETLAYGTGAISSAVIFYILRNQIQPVKILTKSGEYLVVNLNIEDKKLLGLNLTGNAERY